MIIAIFILVITNLMLSISHMIGKEEYHKSPMEKIAEIMEYSQDGKHLIIKDRERMIKLSVSIEEYEE